MGGGGRRHRCFIITCSCSLHETNGVLHFVCARCIVGGVEALHFLSLTLAETFLIGCEFLSCTPTTPPHSPSTLKPTPPFCFLIANFQMFHAFKEKSSRAHCDESRLLQRREAATRQTFTRCDLMKKVYRKRGLVTTSSFIISASKPSGDFVV